ncbi:uncharacterized protein LOC123979390 [Micropterus dolomieu]|uniref:uncharacterized protein LOC123979390 n=1 Tax=Micropterus dolomieu TaxID=147949 RepID=UPI001E8CDA5D|nr:uncharacterized protein LOC123979390 [Micropterus dolomieu]
MNLQVLVYLDVLIVFGKSLEEHEERLLKVLDCLGEAGLKISLDKCQFCQPHVKYLRHIVSAQGISPDPQEIKAVTPWPQPQDLKTLRSFLGFCGYYRRFIANYAAIVRALLELTKGYAPTQKSRKKCPDPTKTYLKESEPFGEWLLGVNRVVIYNTSCGPELDRLLQSYSQEGFVEMVPWPIDQHLNPSSGWLFSKSGGDVHYFGQLTTLNECIYRSMDRSRYVMLNDIDEIIMPYQHNDLMSLFNTLQQQHPNTGVFLIENHTFPKKPFEESKKGPLPQWRGVPGFNILEHIYREEPDRNIYHPHKMIVQPRMVEQTSVHDVLKMFGDKFKVPPDVCRIIHSPISTPTQRPLEQLHVDTRLWDFKEELLPSVSKVLRRAGLLS